MGSQSFASTGTAMKNSKPWYKQFWPWFLIAIPGSSVITGIFMLTVAFKGQDSLVRDNWYKDGMAINQRMEKREHAKAANLKAFFSFDQEENIVRLRLDNLAADATQDLTLELLHPTIAQRDLSTPLFKTPDNHYFAKLNKTPGGFYYVLVSSVQGDWEIEGKVNFANALNDFELQ